MELKEFVKSAILDIIEGVKEAQDANTTDAVINAQEQDRGIKSRNRQFIDFSIAVTASKSETLGRGLGVSVARIASGGVSSGKMEDAEESAIVKFAIPVRFPTPPEWGYR